MFLHDFRVTMSNKMSKANQCWLHIFSLRMREDKRGSKIHAQDTRGSAKNPPSLASSRVFQPLLHSKDYQAKIKQRTKRTIEPGKRESFHSHRKTVRRYFFCCGTFDKRSRQQQSPRWYHLLWLRKWRPLGFLPVYLQLAVCGLSTLKGKQQKTKIIKFTFKLGNIDSGAQLCVEIRIFVFGSICTNSSIRTVIFIVLIVITDDSASTLGRFEMAQNKPWPSWVHWRFKMAQDPLSRLLTLGTGDR